jgi:hypothetical protein
MKEEGSRDTVEGDPSSRPKLKISGRVSSTALSCSPMLI